MIVYMWRKQLACEHDCPRYINHQFVSSDETYIFSPLDTNINAGVWQRVFRRVRELSASSARVLR